MLKTAASFAFNRLLVLALVAVAVKDYGQSSCQAGGSRADRIGQIVPGLEAITRALQ